MNGSAACGISRGPQITLEEASCYETIPQVPTYRPKESEFREFTMCMSLIERMGAQHMGLCKIIPPASWCPRRGGYKDIDFTIRNPILQWCTGIGGIYLQDVRVQKSMSFKKYEKMSNSAKFQTPVHASVNELETIYWNSIGRLEPIYGANVSGSLTDSDQPYCNIPKLRSMLSDILAQEDIKIGGVNTPYLYFGAWATTFAWHVEDMDLYSINYLHFGAPKLWYCIPPAFARKFEAFAREHFKSEFLACRSFLRHKSILINPKILAAAGIPTRRVLQYEGEIMCTFPYGYHAGFNTGVNCAESTNFALPRWLEYGKHASICKCWDDTVRIEMGPFVRRLQPLFFEAWQRGEQSGPHPLDVYTPRMNRRSKVDFQSDLARTAEEDAIIVADLNVRDLLYTSMVLAKAALPTHLRCNRKLRPLWCGFEPNFERMCLFNQIIGTQEPFCSICAFLWSPLTFRKALREPDKVDPLPTFSEPYLSEVVFCRSPADFANIQTTCDPTSRVLLCSRCQVVVHASCYGVDCGIACDPSNWKCDACASVDDDPQCVLCPIRGGALKALANRRHSNRGERFWVHVACAIAVGPRNCWFIDVRRRVPLLLLQQKQQQHTTQCLSPPRASLLPRKCRSLKAAASPGHADLAQDDTKPAKMRKSDCSATPPDSLMHSSRRASAGGDRVEVKKEHRSSSVLRAALVGELCRPLSDGVGIANASGSKCGVSNAPKKAVDDTEGDRPRRQLRPPFWATQDYLIPRHRKTPSCRPDERLLASLQSSSAGTVTGDSISPDVAMRSRCAECGLPSPGGPYLDLPLVTCWHGDCPSRFHITCAQFGGILIATSQYPHCFYATCRRHPNEYREFEHDEEGAPVQPGDMVYAFYPGNGRYYKAVVVSLAAPRLCKVVFQDGTFSRNTPSDCIINHNWRTRGPPKEGSQVKVRWTDGLEYSAVFQGASVDKWNVRFPNGQIIKLRRDKIFLFTEQIPTHLAFSTLDHPT